MIKALRGALLQIARRQRRARIPRNSLIAKRPARKTKRAARVALVPVTIATAGLHTRHPARLDVLNYGQMMLFGSAYTRGSIGNAAAP